MNKEELTRICQEHNSSVLSFPERGPFGDPKYRGNCSGFVIASLCLKYKANSLGEVFAGSGTGSDVAKVLGIPYVGVDLNPNPLRNDIISCDAIKDDVPMQFSFADMVFMHPPYSELIKIPYANSMYACDKALEQEDLGRMPWDKFMKSLNEVVLKYYSAMKKGAFMSILMGNVRRSGRYYSMLNDIVKPGELVQTLVKIQHNCMSGGRSYSGGGFYPTDHEDILVIRKPEGLIITFKYPYEGKMDVRDSKATTWRDVVFAVLQNTDKPMTLDDIYSAIDGHKKCEGNPNWRAKVRQVLQVYAQHKARGIWAAA